ncbi:MAG: hypothetical protein HKN12_10880 [Gemmatimonadetes bacterium]|nr:hypothetical protein [Gemmatimonadota bacterium]
MIRSPWQVSAVLLPAALAACSDPDSDLMSPPDDPGAITLTATAFPAFAQSEGHFELWIAFGAGPVSAGRFKVREGGAIVGTDYQPTSFAVDAADPAVPVDGEGRIRWSAASEVLVSVETSNVPAPRPARITPGPVLLGGTFLNGSAGLSPTHAGAIGENFGSASGSFVLATPSTQTTADETNGVWFVSPGGGSASLALPDLAGDWIYEGWVTNNSAGTASLGRFRSATAADTDGAGPLDGVPPTDAPGYPFPGSDFPFADPGVTLAAGSVFVTAEPVGNADGDGPFFLELMGAPVPGGATPGTSIAMNGTASFPTVTVTVPAAP